MGWKEFLKPNDVRKVVYPIILTVIFYVLFEYLKSYYWRVFGRCFQEVYPPPDYCFTLYHNIYANFVNVDLITYLISALVISYLLSCTLVWIQNKKIKTKKKK